MSKRSKGSRWDPRQAGDTASVVRGDRYRGQIKQVERRSPMVGDLELSQGAFDRDFPYRRRADEDVIGRVAQGAAHVFGNRLATPQEKPNDDVRIEQIPHAV
mgnify:CR=1 FL=1